MGALTRRTLTTSLMVAALAGCTDGSGSDPGSGSDAGGASDSTAAPAAGGAAPDPAAKLATATRQADQFGAKPCPEHSIMLLELAHHLSEECRTFCQVRPEFTHQFERVVQVGDEVRIETSSIVAYAGGDEGNAELVSAASPGVVMHGAVL